MTITVSPRRVGRILNLGVVLLVLAHVAGQYSAHVLGHPSLKGTVPLFNMNGEGSVPTWYASLLLIACALMLGLMALGAQRSSSPFWRSWAGLALAFFYLALDEGVGLHELAIDPLRVTFGITGGWLYFAWIVPAALVVLVVAVAYLPFLRHLPAPSRSGFIVAGGLFVGGALGVEAIGGWYLSTRGDDFTYELIGGFEEVLELVGVVVLLTTLIRHYAGSTTDLHLRFLKI